MPSDSDKALVLNYIDKLYASLYRFWDISARLTAVAVTLALLTLITASNVVTVGEDFSVFGIGFKVAIPTLLAGSVIAITILLYVVQRLTEQQDRLSEEITRLYKQIGLEERGIEEDAVTPLQRPSVYNALIKPFTTHLQNGGASEVSPLKAYISYAIVLSVGEFLPLVAQVLAWLKAASLWGWPHWAWLLVLPICSNLYRFVSTYLPNVQTLRGSPGGTGTIPLVVVGRPRVGFIRILLLILVVGNIVGFVRWGDWIAASVAIAIGAVIVFIRRPQ
jgi:hypothetical protein